MEGRMTVALISIFVCIVLVGAVIVPTIDNVSSGSGWDETIERIYNEDPDLQFDKQTSNFALDMSVTIGDDVTITNGEDTVTAPYGAMFLLAADNSAIFISVADDLIFTWSDDSGKHSLTLAGDFTAVIADGKLTINDGTAHDAPLPALYLYIPSSTGGYGSFASGELAKRAADPVIAAGSFAGAVGYNSSVTLVGDAMVMDADATDTLITSVEWIKAPAAEPAVVPFDPSSITIQPLDPSVLDPEPDVSIMSVPTPSYTDGDWGYNLKTVSGVQKAIIVSYSGSGNGPVTIPSTVGGYDVIEVGKGSVTDYSVFDQTVSSTITDLTISEGITTINKNAFSNSKFTGTLTLPSTLVTVGESAFNSCRDLTGNLVIPDSVTTIGNNGFSRVEGVNTIIIPSSVTSIGTYAFLQGTVDGAHANLISFLDQSVSIQSNSFNNFREGVLNLGSLELTTGSYGITSTTVQDFIGADVYIAPATVTEVIHHSGSDGMSAMWAVIPLVVVAAVLVAAAAMFISKRQY